MASLRNIMNVDVDDDNVNSRSLKDTGSRSSQYPNTPVTPGAYRRGSDYPMSTSPSRDQRMSPSSRSLHSLPVDQHASAMSYSQTSNHHHSDRRQSNTSTDSMDSHYGQGHGYSHGHSGSFSSATMRQFMPQQEVPVKLTPITGRVSRAKKGVPVHTCDICRPPKTFTRAEHLRRHQLSHQPPDLPCPVLGCDKVFHRRDLLERHQQRHDQEDRVGRPNSGTPSRSPYNPGGRRRPSYTTSSPPGSLIQIKQSYGEASPTGTAPGIPIDTTHWAVRSSTPVSMHNANIDVIMREIKSEYILGSAHTVQTTPPNAPAEFSQPRSMPSIAAMDPIQGLCPPAAAASTMSWPTTTPTNAHVGFSSPPSVMAVSERRPDMPISHRDWATIQQSTATRGIPTSVIATGGGYPVSYGYGHPLPQTYTPLYEDEPAVGIPGYSHQPALYGTHIQAPAMRSLSPPIVIGQSSETMITGPAPLPADRTMNTFSYKGELSPRLGLLSHDLMPELLSGETRSALPNYIGIYWDKVHPLYPIIHRSTMEDGADITSDHIDVLRCAMAAVATQVLGHREHRINGSQLHAYAWHKSKSFTQSEPWSLPTMQTILLCEYYARFRGRNKDDYQPSARFLRLYQMVSGYRSTSIPDLSGNKSQRWSTWIYVESCRRLLSACFLLSVHGMCYHEQPYNAVLGVENMAASRFDIPLSGSTTTLWEARNADAWAAIDMSTIKLTTVGDVMQDESSSKIENPAFDVSLVIAAHALRLPTRQSREEVVLVEDASSFNSNDLLMSKYFGRRPGATTYIALHYTPLHVLLAVSGDSWVFNKKIPDASVFAEHKRKLGQWRNSGSSAIATVFAARAIRDFLSLVEVPGNGIASAPATYGAGVCKDISDYWGLYVCTLICWAFGHVGKRSIIEKRLPARTRAISWIHNVAEMEPGQLQASPGREDSQAIVGFVRDILEKDCLGGRNILFADSVGVLRKLEEVDNWSWF
ncbi:hypothetical protein QQS21_008592 [Conoideocrella luteorostrata]|uniref:C2H2-type domain-containing protein n=1 Tax=Conoideocrella luteorostrata TaxID=1105319 RepID=A0AAJ0FYJ5_9HYPO|nr:hypothetical protein QQS21_008592 [Conoideocrella luteorostrata]